MFYREDNGKLRWKSSEDLVEMANLEPEETGLAYLVWVGPHPTSHGPRVKVVSEKGKVSPRNSFSISIEDEPKVVVGKADIPARDLKKIIEWIKENKDILLRHGRMEVTDRQMRSQIKRV